MNAQPANTGKIQDKERKSDGTFQPGVSGNPAGKPKGTKHFATIFNEILKEEIEIKGHGTMSLSKAMSMAMARKAIKGDVSAFNAVADRVDGKPKNDVDLSVVTVDEETRDSTNAALAKFLNGYRRNTKKQKPE